MAIQQGKRWWLLLACCLLAALVLVWRMWRMQPLNAQGSPRDPFTAVPPQAASAPLAAAARSSFGHRTSPPTGSQSSPLSALPPAGTRIKDFVNELRDAADHGDVRAACRVGLELGRCRQHYQLQEQLQRDYDKAVRDNPQSANTAKRLDRLQEFFAYSAPDQALCEGVQESDTSGAWSYVLQAATAGNSAAAVYFLNTPPSDRVVDESAILDAWAEHREQFTQMAIQSGDVFTLFQAQLMAALGIGWGGQSRSFPKSPYQVIEYGAALQLFDPSIPANTADFYKQAEQSLTSDEIASAKAAGKALWEKYYANAQPLTSTQLTPLRPDRC